MPVHMRVKALFVAVLFAAGGLLGAGPAARAQSLADLVQACRDNGGSEAMCMGLYQLLRIPGGICRDATSNAAECELIDGITIDEALVRAHEASWLNRALSLQRQLDDAQPLEEELWTHTHNSFNADAYAPQALGGQDRNHIYSVGDQLRMGIRAIELDVHWSPHVTTLDENAVQVCHGNAGLVPVPPPAGPLHLGCELNSPLLTEHLAEIEAWMEANPDEVILLYLQNELEDDPAAHDEAAAAIEEAFGSLVYRPQASAGACTPLPMDASRKDIYDAGKRILLTGNCGPGAWNSWVHDRGPRWREGGLGYGDDYPAYPCAERRAEQGYDQNWIRHWGDETGLSAGAQSGGDVTPTDAANMTKCGVNMIGFDNLVPFDERLVPLVWSWAPDQPSTDDPAYCASSEADGRFYAKKCTVTRVVKKIPRRNKPPKRRVTFRFVSQPFACFDGTDWHVTRASDRWSNGDETCDREGLGDFAAPWNGYENERLKAAKPDGTRGVWLAHRGWGL